MCKGQGEEGKRKRREGKGEGRGEVRGEEKGNEKRKGEGEKSERARQI